MLLEFRVKNFKSIRNEMIFSMNASKDKSLEETHLLQTGIKSIPALVCSAAIYGPNASGKSNLISAIAYLKGVVAESASLQVDQTFNIKTFVLDPETANAPSEFEITFLKEGVRYQYGFMMTSKRIIEEWLYVYKTAKAQHWFSRKYDEDKQQDSFEFGSSFKGQKDTWKKSTRGNALFLSTAVQLNSEQLTPIFSWITQDLVIFGAQGMPHNDFSTNMLQNEQGKQDITNFLISADICIDDVSVTTKKGLRQKIEFNTSTGKADSSVEDADILVPLFHHKTNQGSAIFELPEESLGTQRLFTLAGPILDILKEGRVLIFDELDSSLHTLLARRLVELFHTPELNTHGAQLVFSTHDTALLHDELLRRDQVWFIEKDTEQVSNLYALTDFSPRKNESIERGYMIGRYGAVPFLQDIKPVTDKFNGS